MKKDASTKIRFYGTGWGIGKKVRNLHVTLLLVMQVANQPAPCPDQNRELMETP